MIDIHGYDKRLESARRRLAKFGNASFLLAFVDHLGALGLSTGRIAKHANHLCTLMGKVPFNPLRADRKDIERVVGWINSQPYKSSTKDDLKLVVRKVVQFARYGSCANKTPTPPEVAWFSVNKRNDKDSKVRPETLLTMEDVRGMIDAAENERDRALVSVLFEAALRPGELLTMRVGSVAFNDGYCLIAVSGKTGVRRIPLVASYKLLLEWLERHPKKGDLNAPLWISLRALYYQLFVLPFSALAMEDCLLFKMLTLSMAKAVRFSFLVILYGAATHWWLPLASWFRGERCDTPY